MCVQYLTLFLVLFCSAKQAKIELAPSQFGFLGWDNEPTEADEGFFAGDDSGGEEEELKEYSLKEETEQYL